MTERTAVRENLLGILRSKGEEVSTRGGQERPRRQGLEPLIHNEEGTIPAPLDSLGLGEGKLAV